jgi:hypothetical protein
MKIQARVAWNPMVKMLRIQKKTRKSKMMMSQPPTESRPTALQET